MRRQDERFNWADLPVELVLLILQKLIEAAGNASGQYEVFTALAEHGTQHVGSILQTSAAGGFRISAS